METREATESVLRHHVRAKVVARAYDLGVSTIYDLASRGIIPSVKIGGAVRFDLDAVRDALARQAEGQARANYAQLTDDERRPTYASRENHRGHSAQ